MSLILEPPRKSESQRRLGQAPYLHTPAINATPRRLPRWLVPALEFMLVGALAWWMGRMAVPDPAIGTANTAANWMSSFMIARPGTIYAGTSEVQRNIIGERVLGLPREPRADGGTWRESQAAYR